MFVVCRLLMPFIMAIAHATRVRVLFHNITSAYKLTTCRWRTAVGHRTSIVVARLLAAIVHSWEALQANEASHSCHTNCCVDEQHVLPESKLLNAERERCRK